MLLLSFSLFLLLLFRFLGAKPVDSCRYDPDGSCRGAFCVSHECHGGGGGDHHPSCRCRGARDPDDHDDCFRRRCCCCRISFPLRCLLSDHGIRLLSCLESLLC